MSFPDYLPGDIAYDLTLASSDRVWIQLCAGDDDDRPSTWTLNGSHTERLLRFENAWDIANGHLLIWVSVRDDCCIRPEICDFGEVVSLQGIGTPVPQDWQANG